MKKIISTAILALVASLFLMGCDFNPKAGAPVLEEFWYTTDVLASDATAADIKATQRSKEIKSEEQCSFILSFSDVDLDVIKFCYSYDDFETVKEDAITQKYESQLTRFTTALKSSKTQEVTVKGYLEDAKGKKSETFEYTFTVVAE